VLQVDVAVVLQVDVTVVLQVGVALNFSFLAGGHASLLCRSRKKIA